MYLNILPRYSPEQAQENQGQVRWQSGGNSKLCFVSTNRELYELASLSNGCLCSLM